MVQSGPGYPGLRCTGGGCRDPFRNNITKIKTFIAAAMFIFLQYCKISRVSQLCREAASDSYVINYNFLPPLLNCNWCDIIPVKRNALQLHTHWQTLICANGRSDLSGARPPFLFTTRTLHWLSLTKRVRVVISPELGQNVYFCWFFTKRLKSFTNHRNSIPLFWPRS